jgi:ankyrin repeat domain-containing protein 50
MAEVLAGPASVAGLLGLTITTIQLSHAYISSVKGSTKTIKAYFSELELLKTALQEFQKLAEDDDTSEYLSLLDVSQSEACQKELERLHVKLEKRSRGSSLSKSLGRLTWPFSEEEIADAVKALHRYRSSLDSILSAALFKLSSHILSEVKHTRKVQHEQTTKVSYKWLSITSPASNHQSAQAKRLQGTGQWFLNSSAFESWLDWSCRSLWVNAIPGSGKTILCSTIIDHVLSHQRPDEAIAYFYFDFSDSSRQKLNACLRSLLAQLCSALPSMPQVVVDLMNLSESSARNGFLKDDELVSAFLSVCSGDSRCRVVIDALDENTDQQDLMDSIKALAECPNISLLTTSRKDRNIEDVLSEVMDVSITLNSTNVDKDIGAYVVECLQKDSKLKKRPLHVKKCIEDALTSKSKGM